MNITINAYSEDAMKTNPPTLDEVVCFDVAKGKCVAITIGDETAFIPFAALEVVTNAMRDAFKAMGY